MFCLNKVQSFIPPKFVQKTQEPPIESGNYFFYTFQSQCTYLPDHLITNCFAFMEIFIDFVYWNVFFLTKKLRFLHLRSYRFEKIRWTPVVIVIRCYVYWIPWIYVYKKTTHWSQNRLLTISTCKWLWEQKLKKNRFQLIHLLFHSFCEFLDLFMEWKIFRIH